jgi:hypothetical protein
MIYNKIVTHILNNLMRFKNTFIVQLEESIDENISQKKDVVINNYQEELNEIYTIISDEANKTINSQITKVINEKVNLFNIEGFVTSLGLIKRILAGSTSYHLDLAEKDFVTAFYESKEKKLYESVDCESWNYEAHNVPENYQLMLNFLEKTNFIELRDSLDSQSITKLYDDSLIYSIDEKTNPLLELNGHKYRLFMLTTLDIIKLAYETTKIFLHLDNGDLAIGHFIKILSAFVKLNNDTVLESKEYKLITPKKVAIVCSNVNIVKNIISTFILFDKQSSYNEVIQLSDNVLSLAKSKFIHDYFPQR